MRVILFLLAIGLGFAADAQDYCKAIKKEVSENKVLTEYFSPFKQDSIPAVRIKRSISTDEDYPYDTYTVIFQTYCGLDDIYDKKDGSQTEKPEKKLVITLDDNSTIIDDTTDVIHDFTPDRTEAIRSLYFVVPESVVNELGTKKIVKFTLAGQEKIVPPNVSNSFMQYANCIKTARK
jgi:hypothetical protein